MPNTRSDFSSLLFPGVHKHIFDEQKRRDEQYSKIFNKMTSNRQFEDDYTLAGFGAMPQKSEGTAVIYDEAEQGYTKRYTHITYGMGFRATQELQEDDLYSKVAKFAKGLGRSALHTVETTSANVFNTGFTAADGGDGKELFATDHPLVGGGTAANEPAVAVDLSQTALQDALIEMEDTVDDRGLPLRIEARKLVVPNALRFTASEILKSGQKLDSDHNNFNALQDVDLKWMIWHYLTDTDAWFLVGDIHNVNFFWRRPPQLTSGMDFDTDDAKFKLTQRFSVGYSDWRGVYGSPGA